MPESGALGGAEDRAISLSEALPQEYDHQESSLDEYARISELDRAATATTAVERRQWDLIAASRVAVGGWRGRRSIPAPNERIASGRRLRL